MSFLKANKTSWGLSFSFVLYADTLRPYILRSSRRDVNETLHDETETFKKHASRRPRPRRSRYKTETLTETFKLKEGPYSCKFGKLFGMLKNFKHICIKTYQLWGQNQNKANCNVVNHFDHKFHYKTSTVKIWTISFNAITGNGQNVILSRQPTPMTCMHCHAVFTCEIPDGYKERKLSYCLFLSLTTRKLVETLCIWDAEFELAS